MSVLNINGTLVDIRGTWSIVDDSEHKANQAVIEAVRAYFSAWDSERGPVTDKFMALRRALGDYDDAREASDEG